MWMCVLRGIILLLPSSNSSKNVITALQADACQQKESETKKRRETDKRSAGHEGESE